MLSTPTGPEPDTDSLVSTPEADPALHPEIENPILHVDDLSLWYGDAQALQSVSLKIPAGTQSHKIFRMRGKGMPHVNRPGSGDQLVRVLSWTPENLDKPLRKRLEDLQTDLADRIPPPGRHLFD